jgi:hypothetical protein
MSLPSSGAARDLPAAEASTPLPSLEEPVHSAGGRPRDREVDGAVDLIIDSTTPRLHRTWPQGFLTPLTVLVAKRTTLRGVLRLWVGTLAGNLIGGLVIAWLVRSRHRIAEHRSAVEAKAVLSER